MSRRQSFPESSRQHPSPFEQIKDLKLQIQLKSSQIEDLKFQLATLRKKQSIWHHLGQTYEKSQSEQESRSLISQNEKLKSQVCSMVKQLESKNSTIQEQGDKIRDLRDYVAELKRLGEKSQSLHRREVEFVKAEFGASGELAGLKRDKERLEAALKECDGIAKEMEEYYMGEIEKLKNQLEEQRSVIVRLETNKSYFEQELLKKQKELQDSKNRGSHESRDKESEINQLIMRQNLQKKWEIVLTQVRQRYEKEVSELKDQIRFLIVKIESMQDSKNCYEGLTASVLTHSKLGMSSASNESFRFTPNNSFSSSIKESLSRRDAGPLRTPSKSSRQSNNLGYLLDRTNL